MEPLASPKLIESEKNLSNRNSFLAQAKNSNKNLKLPLDGPEISYSSSKPTTASTRYGGFRKKLGKSSSQMFSTQNNFHESPKGYAKSHRKLGFKSTDVDSSSQEDTYNVTFNLKSSDEIELLQIPNKKSHSKKSFQIELAEKLKNTIGIDKVNHYNFGNSLPGSFDKESQNSSLINLGEHLGTIQEDLSSTRKKELTFNLKNQHLNLINNTK